MKRNGLLLSHVSGAVTLSGMRARALGPDLPHDSADSTPHVDTSAQRMTASAPASGTVDGRSDRGQKSVLDEPWFWGLARLF